MGYPVPEPTTKQHLDCPEQQSFSMRNLGVLTGFLPLVVYGLLSGNSLEQTQVALLAATIVSVIVGYQRLKRGFYLDWANTLMFAGALFCLSVLNIPAIVDYMHIIIYGVLMLVAFGSLLLGVPFTVQYARDMVDKSLWENPVFVSINQLMTGVWGGIFAINLALVTYSKFGAGPAAQAAGLLVWGFLILGILFTLLYPEYFRKKHPWNARSETNP
jgi:hypothetical protein